MADHQQGWAPSVISDVAEDDGDNYTIGIRAADAPDAWSLMFMEPAS